MLCVFNSKLKRNQIFPLIKCENRNLNIKKVIVIFLSHIKLFGSRILMHVE